LYYFAYSKNIMIYPVNGNRWLRKTVLPARSEPLGFNCPGCNRDYGSIQVYTQSDRTRGRTVKSNLNFQEIPNRRRSTLKPVEYAWKNKILSEHQEELIESHLNSIMEIRNSSELIAE
jgi:hypothetical protein